MRTTPSGDRCQSSPAPGGDLELRAATLRDAAAIAAIWNEGIEDRTATFETRPRTTGAISSWIGAGQPVVVVEDRALGRVVGFAGASPYHPGRDFYAGIAEFSVYVARAARGRGVGTLAMRGLIRACDDGSRWKLLSRIFVDNEASRRLMRRLGFHEVGVYRRHARLAGRWRDVVIVERLLGEAARLTVEG